MDEILLGSIAIDSAHTRGRDLWWERTGGVGDLREFQDEEVCRAQVAQVMEWLEKNNTNTDTYFEEQRYHPALKYIEVQMSKGDIWLEDTEVLRAAAGMEGEE